MNRTPPANSNLLSLTWGCCNTLTNDENYIQCLKCQKAYHLDCLSIKKISKNTEWTCALCTPRESKNDSTPLHSKSSNKNVAGRPNKRAAVNSPPGISDVLITRDEVQSMVHDMLQKKTPAKDLVTPETVKNIVQQVIQSELRALVPSITSEFKSVFNAELRSIKEEIIDIKQSMTFIDSQYEDFLNEHKANKENMKELREENITMRATINDLSSRLNQVEQNARSSNIELQCVPEKKDENLINLVLQIAKTVESNITANDISHCTRVAKYNNNSPRPRSVIVQFGTPTLRNKFLTAAIKFNKAKKDVKDKLNSTHIGYNDNSQIFVVEHLSAANKALHAATRLKAKEKGYKYVWIRGGRIFARKGDDDGHIYVKDSTHLDKIV